MNLRLKRVNPQSRFKLWRDGGNRTLVSKGGVPKENRMALSGFTRLNMEPAGLSLVVLRKALMNFTMTPGQQPQGTVLIVDDDLDDIKLTQRIIGSVRPKLCIRSVLSGEELIRYLQGENEFSDRTEFPYPTLVLLDLKMPGMHGFEVLRWLARQPPHNLIPVVVLTVSGEISLAQYAYQLGARSFLTKPLKASEFKGTIGKFELELEQSTARESRSCGKSP